jgi:hypothetical protein
VNHLKTLSRYFGKCRWFLFNRRLSGSHSWYGAVRGKSLSSAAFRHKYARPYLNHYIDYVIPVLSLSRIISEGEVVCVHAMKCYVLVEVQIHSFFPFALDGNEYPASYSGPFKLVEDPQFSNE